MALVRRLGLAEVVAPVESVQVLVAPRGLVWNPSQPGSLQAQPLQVSSWGTPARTVGTSGEGSFVVFLHEDLLVLLLSLNSMI